MDASLAGYQFIHVDWTTQSGGKVKKTFKARHGDETKATGWKPFDIFAEVMRFEGHFPHVECPKPPLCLLGHQDAFDTQKDIDAWLACREQVDGKKYASNRPVIANGVISFPRERGEEDWLPFRDRAIDWLQRKYGEALRCIMEHGDEGHFHFHWYAVPRYGTGPDGKPFADDFATVHQGYAARNGARTKAAKEKGGDWSAGGSNMNTAYIQAMRELQDEFQHEVARFHNLDRKGPGQEREPHHVVAERKRRTQQISADLVAAEKAERESRKARELAQQQLFDAEQARRDAETYAAERMAAAQQAQAEAEAQIADWKARQQRSFDDREKAVAAEEGRLEAERVRLAALAAGVKQTETRNFFLEDTNRELLAENLSLRKKLAEVTGEIVRLLKHVGRTALGPFVRIYDKYIGSQHADDGSIAKGQGGLEDCTKSPQWKS